MMLHLTKLTADTSGNLILTVKGPADKLPEGEAYSYATEGDETVCTVPTANHPALLILGECLLYEVGTVEVPAEDADFDQWFRDNFIPDGQIKQADPDPDADEDAEAPQPETEAQESVDLLDPSKDEAPQEEAAPESSPGDQLDLRTRLEALSRKQVQAVAKSAGVKAVGKTADIIGRLLEKEYTEVISFIEVDYLDKADEPATEAEETVEAQEPEGTAEPAAEVNAPTIENVDAEADEAAPASEISEEDKEKLKALNDEITYVVGDVVEGKPKSKRKSKKAKKAAKAEPPAAKGPTPMESLRAQLAKMTSMRGDLKALADEFGVRRVTLAISEMLLGGGAGLPMGHVPGLVVSVTKNHPAKAGRKWGRCEYVVECLEEGRLKLVDFKGNRPALRKAVGTEYDSMNDLMQVISGRSYARVTFAQFFKIDTAKADGRIVHDPRD